MVRLEDVGPDGAVTMVMGAALNGAERDSMRDPKPLAVGENYPLTVRVAISNALWPMIWPTPYPMTTQLKRCR
jgi:uncharacterized protein